MSDMVSVPRIFSLSDDYEICRFDNGQWSFRQKIGGDVAHIRYLHGFEKQLVDTVIAAMPAAAPKPDGDAVVQKTHFADDDTLAHIAKLERELAQARLTIKQMERDARENANGAASEAVWKERQGDEYGSY